MLKYTKVSSHMLPQGSTGPPASVEKQQWNSSNEANASTKSNA